MRRGIRLRPRLAALATALVVALAGCGGNSGDQVAGLPDSPRKATNELILLSRQDPGTWDLVKTGTTIQWRWLPRNVLETLVIFDEKGAAHPSLAESWKISEDRTEYTFTIRQGVTFHNGVKLDAEQAAASLRSFWQSPNAMRSGPLQAIKSIEATDGSTMKVTLSHPSLLFWRELGGVGGTVYEQGSADQLALKPIGTGPYEFAEYVPNDHITLTAFDGYWGDEPKIKEVKVRFVDDTGASFNALRSGEVDGAPYLPQTMLARTTAEGYDKLYTLSVDGAGGQLNYAAMNTRKPPFDDLELRQAVAHALDRSAYVEAIGADWAVHPTCTFATPEKPYFSETECELPYDPAKSTGLAAHAGVTEPFAFSYLTDSAIGDVIGAHLEAAGLKFTNRPMEFARYSQVVLAGKPPDFLFTEISTPRDLWQFSCPSAKAMNWHSFCDPATTAKLREADEAKSFEEQSRLLAEADRLLQRQAIVVTLLATASATLLHPDVKGYAPPVVSSEVNLSALHWAE